MTIKDNNKEYTFIKVVTPFTRERACDFIISKTEEMDKILDILDEINNVVSIFTTNRIRIFDSAFIRPGRIDKVYTYNLPDKKHGKNFLMFIYQM
mgnify:CR=1 FL=1